MLLYTCINIHLIIYMYVYKSVGYMYLVHVHVTVLELGWSCAVRGRGSAHQHELIQISNYIWGKEILLRTNSKGVYGMCILVSWCIDFTCTCMWYQDFPFSTSCISLVLLYWKVIWCYTTLFTYETRLRLFNIVFY